MIERYFSALRSRNFRLYLTGQGVSLVGTWMQQVAMGWLVYRLSGSAWLLGVAGFVSQFPLLVLSPVAGVWADRVDRRKLALVTQSLLMIQAFLLAILTLSGHIQVWHILVLDAFFGLINAMDIPTRQSFVPMLVQDRNDIGNAIALNATMVNSTRLLGPAVAGLLVATMGEGVCFLMNAVSFLAVLLCLAALKMPPAYHGAERRKTLRHELRDGFQYAFGTPKIRAALLLLGGVSFMGTPYTTLLPVFAADVLKGGPRTLGALTASSGSGALLAAVYLIVRKKGKLGRQMILSAMMFGMGLILFSQSHWLPMSALGLVICGFGIMSLMGAANTRLQLLTDDLHRGRVMSLYVMMLLGVAPIGSLTLGILATHIGAPSTVTLGGVICVCVSLWFWRQQRIDRTRRKAEVRIPS